MCLWAGVCVCVVWSWLRLTTRLLHLRGSSPAPCCSTLLSLPVLHLPADGYDLEGYNPELPGLTGPSRQKQYRHFIPRVQTQRTNLIGLTSGDGQSSRGEQTLTPIGPTVCWLGWWQGLRVVAGSKGGVRVLGWC